MRFFAMPINARIKNTNDVTAIAMERRETAAPDIIEIVNAVNTIATSVSSSVISPTESSAFSHNA